MARGLNKVMLIGNLGDDPQQSTLPSGGSVTNVTLATSESWKDKNTGQQQERTEWHRVVFFNGLAEVVAEYTHKGSKIYVEGSLRTRKWQDQSGQDRYTTEIVANEMQLLDGNPNSGSQGNNGSGGQQQQQSSRAPQPRQNTGQQNRQQNGGANRQSAPRGNGNQQQQGSGNQNRQQQRPQQQRQQQYENFDDFDPNFPFATQ